MIVAKINGLPMLIETMDGMEKQARFAASRALNEVAFEVMRTGRSKLQAAFDRPTPWTVNSWYVRKKAIKSDLTAVVGWSDFLGNKQFKGADYFLAQHFVGGSRMHKRFEERLIQAGIMPSGMFAVPGQAAQELGMIDKYGNMKASVIVAILSGLSALSGPGHSGNAANRKRWSANKRAAARVYWAGKPGVNTPNGIWMIDEKFSKRGRLRPIIIFVRGENYRKRLDMQAISDAVAMNKFDEAFQKELDSAIRTAK